VALTDLDGTKIEYEKFTLEKGIQDLRPSSVARDAFNLLYQAVSGAVNEDESDGMQ